jgi:hypothetical protein
VWEVPVAVLINPFATLLPSIIKPHTHTHYPGIGEAANCQVNATHDPVPLRYVWHHILPQGAGGKTEPDNLASLCDTCHYAVHALLSGLAKNGQLDDNPDYHPDRVALAQQGYDAAVAKGTVDKIPHESQAVA